MVTPIGSIKVKYKKEFIMRQTRRFLLAVSLAAAITLSGCSLFGDSASDVTEKETAEKAIQNTEADTASGQDNTGRHSQ